MTRRLFLLLAVSLFQVVPSDGPAFVAAAKRLPAGAVQQRLLDTTQRRLLDSTLFEGPDRDRWQRPDYIMDALGIADGAVVADIGTGRGWFAVRLARRVGPRGLVVAEDILPEMLDAVERRASREGWTNVETVLGTPDDPKLTPGRFDAVLVVDTYHEVENGPALLGHLRDALKPSGRLGIVDYRTDGGGPGPPTDNRIDADAVIRDAEGAGLTLLTRDSSLPFQYLLIFALPPSASRDAPTLR